MPALGALPLPPVPPSFLWCIPKIQGSGLHLLLWSKVKSSADPSMRSCAHLGAEHSCSHL